MSSVATAEVVIPSFDRVRVLNQGKVISDAELIDQDGKPFRFSDLRGRVALVFFGFTHCPDVCPMTMERFRQLEISELVDAEQLAFVLISVDGNRDSPEVLKSYLEKFSPDFIGLTAPVPDVKAIAKEFRASFYKGEITGGNNDYSVMHSPQAFVLDREGKLRAEFYQPTVEAMAAVTKALLMDAE